MADFRISKKDLFGKLGYVSTQSGPVTPSRDKIIRTMKSGVKPVKDQTSDYWDTRKYDNDSLASRRNWLNLRDIGIKVMTESTVGTSYSPMRLNLSGIDMADSNLNGTFQCDGHMVTVNMRYPNANNAISVELTLDTGDTNLYEVPIDSDQFQGNFAQAIRMSARDLIKSVEEPEDFDEMMSGERAISGVGNDFNDVLGVANMEPSAMVATESVDWRLQRLLNICLEAGEGEDFGADDFSMGTDAAPAGDGGMEMGDLGGGDMGGGAAPEDAGAVNGNPEGNGNGDETLEFREFVLPSDPSHGSGLTEAAWDNIAAITANALSRVTSKQYSGVKPDENEWYDGFPGTKFSSHDDLLEQFLSFDEYKALDTALPLDGLKQMAHYLEGKLDINKFKTSLGRWFPDVYNTNGTAMHDIAKDVAGMSLPGDNTGLDMNSPVDMSGDFGGGDFGGGDLGGGDMMFDDTEGMMDMANDMAGGGIDASEGQDENGLDDTDIAVDALGQLG